jgi:hypothetical protein
MPMVRFVLEKSQWYSSQLTYQLEERSAFIVQCLYILRGKVMSALIAVGKNYLVNQPLKMSQYQIMLHDAHEITLEGLDNV